MNQPTTCLLVRMPAVECDHGVPLIQRYCEECSKLEDFNIALQYFIHVATTMKEEERTNGTNKDTRSRKIKKRGLGTV
mgnify:CR=1 FL=1